MPTLCSPKTPSVIDEVEQIANDPAFNPPDKKQQMKAVKDFKDGNIDYAKMRALCG